MNLTMNNFTFNDSHYLQIHGTAMGTKMAPSFANLFLGLFEKNALRNAPFQPQTWLRYIDGIFMIWTESPENLKIFIDYLNNIHPTIKFTSSHSPTSVPFLDVNVSLTSDGNINTDLYTKPTDKHQHLLYSSCHPTHKKSHPFQPSTPPTTNLFYRRNVQDSHHGTNDIPSETRLQTQLCY